MHHRVLRLVIPVGLGLASAGCASLTHYNHARVVPLTDGRARAVFADAKQRVVTFVPTEQGLRVCAEPSPDGLSALAAAANGKLTAKDYGAAAGSASLAETASSIGLRTQSITLMRDVLYRLCEDYQSRALGPAALETLQRRYQSSLIAVLAIEQLTGTVKATPVLLSTNSEAIAKLADETVAARADNAKAKTKADAAANGKAKADAALVGVPMDAKPDDKKAAQDAASMAQSENDQASASLKQSDADLKDREQALAAISAGDTRASAAASVGDATDTSSAGDRAAIATAVQGIVHDTLELGFLREVCATLFVSQLEGRTRVQPGDKGIGDACVTYSNGTAQLASSQATAFILLVTDISKRSAAGQLLSATDREILTNVVKSTYHEPSGQNNLDFKVTPTVKIKAKKTTKLSQQDLDVINALSRIKPQDGQATADMTPDPKPIG